MTVTAVPLRPIARGAMTKLWLGIAVLLLGAAALAWAGTDPVRAQFATDAEFMAKNAKQPGVTTTASGLQYRVLAKGSGTPPVEGQLTLIGYTGRLRDGVVFDQNPKAPMLTGATIPGFDEALRMMSKGAKYELWIPADLAYGAEEKVDSQTGKAVIPANSMLNFEVELLDILSLEDSQKVLSGQMPPGIEGAAPPAGQR